MRGCEQNQLPTIWIVMVFDWSEIAYICKLNHSFDVIVVVLRLGGADHPNIPLNLHLNVKTLCIIFDFSIHTRRFIYYYYMEWNISFYSEISLIDIDNTICGVDLWIPNKNSIISNRISSFPFKSMMIWYCIFGRNFRRFFLIFAPCCSCCHAFDTRFTIFNEKKSNATYSVAL